LPSCTTLAGGGYGEVQEGVETSEARVSACATVLPLLFGA
jgi:hypothetical protein